jgi:hypothetical protein
MTVATTNIGKSALLEQAKHRNRGPNQTIKEDPK